MIRLSAKVVANALNRVLGFFEIIMLCDEDILSAEIMPKSFELTAIHSSFDVGVNSMLFIFAGFNCINFSLQCLCE